MKNQQWGIVAMMIIAGLLLLFYGCSSSGSEDTRSSTAKTLDSVYQLREVINQRIAQLEAELGKTARQQRAKIVTVQRVQPQKFEHFLTVVGQVESKQDVLLTPKMSGVVEQVLVKEGQQVEKGQLLAVLDATLLQRQIEQVETSLAFARTVYQKQKRVWEQKAGSEIQYLEAKNRVAVLEKQLATLQEQLSMTKIRAPFRGVIDAVLIKVGEAALVGRPAFRLVRLQDLQVRSEVAERYAAVFRIGQTAQVVFPDLADTLTLAIHSISRSVNPKDRTIQLYFTLPRPVPQLRTGMLAIVTLRDYAKDSTLVLPLSAVQRFENQEYVFVAAVHEGDTVAVRRSVRTGPISGGSIEIVEGLRPGEMVIVQGMQNIAHGDRIAIQSGVQ